LGEAFAMKTNHRLEGPSGAPVATLTHPLSVTLALWERQATPEQETALPPLSVEVAREMEMYPPCE
jgi:hypothetical protein